MQQQRVLRSGVSRLMAIAVALAVSLFASTAVMDTAHAQPGALSAGGPYQGRVGDPIAMEGSLAVTPGSVVQWRWTFGDGGMALGQVVSHTYSSPGTFTVELAVTLENGEVRTASTTAQVVPAMTMPGQLTVQADGPYNGQIGVPVSFNAEVGLGGRPPGTIVEVTWAFGDGSTGTGMSTTHTYSNPGTYRVTVRASVGADQTAFDSTTASIIGQRDIGLSAGGPYSGQVGQNITMTGSIQDPEARVIQWQWDFGDGTSANGRVVQKGYTATGIYQVTLTAILDDGQTFVATTIATIGSSQQISASAGGPYSGAAGQPITMTGSINPVGLAVAQWLWNFGDGTTGSGQTVQKTYSATGTYTVTLQVLPANQGAVTATTTATIGGQAPTEPVRMVTGCNNLALTWQVGTPLMTVVNAVSPPGVTQSIFTLDAAQGRFRGYSPTAPSFANDFTMVEIPLQAVYICVTASSTLNRPVP